MLRRGNSFLYSSNSAAGAGWSRGCCSPVPAPSRNKHREGHGVGTGRLDDARSMSTLPSHTTTPWGASLSPTGLGKAGPAPVLAFLACDQQIATGRASTSKYSCAETQPGKQQQSHGPGTWGHPAAFKVCLRWFGIVGCTFLLLKTGIAGCTPLCATELHNFQTENRVGG